MVNKKDTSDAPFQIPIFTVENKTKVENFFEENKKYITYVLSAVVIILAGFYIYKNFIIKPKEEEAKNLIFMAEDLLSKDSFALALNGKPESFYGFLDIIDEFKMTKTGNLARYYAGVCYLHLGDYEEAVHQLKKYKTTSEMLKPISLGDLGDAYSELEEYSKALKYYKKAAKASDNKFTAPLYWGKAALVCEELGKYKQAIQYYEIIKKEYPNTQEASNVDKFIGRAKAKMAD